LEDGFTVGSVGYAARASFDRAFKEIHDTLCREYGQFRLVEGQGESPRDPVVAFFVDADTDKALDTIELSFQVLETYQWDALRQGRVPTLSTADAVAELNHRFLEHGVGYQFESGQLVRKDSELIHRGVVQPVLLLLTGKEYQGANDEFLSAHEHYRHSNYKESVNDSLKALESTLKVICKKRNWPYKETDTAKTLIDVVLSNGLVPSFLKSQLGSLRSLLESGVPTVRNKMAGHGQGSEPKEVPQHFASYALHMTATTILFLAESERALS
jgi:hypothetical protein